MKGEGVGNAMHDIPPAGIGHANVPDFPSTLHRLAVKRGRLPLGPTENDTSLADFVEPWAAVVRLAPSRI